MISHVSCLSFSKTLTDDFVVYSMQKIMMCKKTGKKTAHCAISFIFIEIADYKLDFNTCMFFACENFCPSD